MTGLGFALIYAVIAAFVFGVEDHVVYDNSTNFLLWWYLLWTIMPAAITVFALVFASLGITGTGAAKYGLKGALLGAAGSGTISFMVVVGFALTYGSSILGAYLMHTAWLDGAPDLLRAGMGISLILFSIIRKKQAINND